MVEAGGTSENVFLFSVICGRNDGWLRSGAGLKEKWNESWIQMEEVQKKDGWAV